MEPVTGLIVGALVAGATAAANGVVSEAVKDAYQALKSLVTRRLGSRAEVVDRVERDPADEAEHAALGVYVKSAGLAGDAEVDAAARRLLAALEELRRSDPSLAVIDVGRFTAESVELSDSEFTEGFFRADTAEIQGSFRVSGLRRAAGPEDPAKKP